MADDFDLRREGAILDAENWAHRVNAARFQRVDEAEEPIVLICVRHFREDCSCQEEN